MNDTTNIIWFKDCSYKNTRLVGGKNASLGELYHLSKKLNFKIVLKKNPRLSSVENNPFDSCN